MTTTPSLRNMRWKLFLFGLFKIPMIGYCRPKLISVNASEIQLRIPFRRRTRNHVGSMYLGVLSIGADLASGFLAFYLLEKEGLKASPVFGEMQAVYHKRAIGDVDFICNAGADISLMIEESNRTKERVTQNIEVKAMCNGEEVATFKMGLSFKVR